LGVAGQIDFKAIMTGLSEPWVDRDFPPDASSIFVDPRSPMPKLAGRKILWRRPSDLIAKPELFVGVHSDANTNQQTAAHRIPAAEEAAQIRQQLVWRPSTLARENTITRGSLKDGFFLSAASMLPREHIQRLFIFQHFERGLLGVRFFKDGRWFDVAIDTLIPCLEDQTPCFVRMSDAHEF